MPSPVRSDDAVRDAERARLTPAEWAWVHPGVALVPAFGALLVALSWLADRTASALPALALAWVAVLAVVLLVRTADARDRRARRVQAVLTRPLREGRHVWAVPDGEHVRVYRIADRGTRMPHAWPLVLGHRAEVAEGLQFGVDDESEEAHRFAAEAERRALPQSGARGLARVLNERR